MLCFFLPFEIDFSERGHPFCVRLIQCLRIQLDAIDSKIKLLYLSVEFFLQILLLLQFFIELIDNYGKIILFCFFCFIKFLKLLAQLCDLSVETRLGILQTIAQRRIILLQPFFFPQQLLIFIIQFSYYLFEFFSICN